MELPTTKRHVSITIMTMRIDGNELLATVKRQFGGSVAVVRVNTSDKAIFYEQHRQLLAHARQANPYGLLLLCTDTCILTEELWNLRRRLDRYVRVLDECQPGWCLINLAPLLLLPVWASTYQTDLLYAAPHGTRCVLFNMPSMDSHIQKTDQWRPPRFVEAWLGIPGSCRFAAWPPVACDPVDVFDLTSDATSVIVGMVIPAVIGAIIAAHVCKLAM